MYFNRWDMKIFFASSTATDDQNSAQRALTEYLESEHQVFHYSHAPLSPNDMYSFNELVEKINASDVFIGEMSKPSQTLGFQLAHALQLSKPCLYLYDGINKGSPAGLIGNIPSRSLKIKKYNQENYKKVIDDFMLFAHKQLFTARTSFMSTREIDDYLTQESARQGISKGELIRQVLHKAIEKS
jgi:hypothetical protein